MILMRIMYKFSSEFYHEYARIKYSYSWNADNSSYSSDMSYLTSSYFFISNFLWTTISSYVATMSKLSMMNIWSCILMNKVICLSYSNTCSRNSYMLVTKFLTKCCKLSISSRSTMKLCCRCKSFTYL